MPRSRVRSLGLALALATSLAPELASAATWGSFSASRIAYVTGPLTGDVHTVLRGYIEDHGDTVAPATPELTSEYLATVDVFYTAMLSDGTGPTAGALGTLSLSEQAALQEFIAGGGTLVITPDSNGFDGPFPLVYDSWLQDYGVTEFAFVFAPGSGMTVVQHPITEDVGAWGVDGTVTFDYPAEGQVLGIVVASSEPMMVVFEPGSGFLEGGRILVLADHNALTDGMLDSNGNQTLAQNIVEWAAGECGNTIVESGEQCDDGNTEDGDGCSAACALDDGGSDGSGGDSGGDSDSGGVDETAGDDTGLPGGSTGAPGTTGTGNEVTDGSEPTGGDGGAAPADPDEQGCGCHSQAPRPGLAALWMLLGAALLRRRRVDRPRA